MPRFYSEIGTGVYEAETAACIRSKGKSVHTFTVVVVILYHLLVKLYYSLAVMLFPYSMYVFFWLGIAKPELA